MRGWLIAMLGLTAGTPCMANVASTPRHTQAAAHTSSTLRALAAAARSILGRHQGVYVEAADGTVLVSQNAATPVHPASVSKVPSTLAMLRKLGPDHRFVTTFASSGRDVDGTLYGDLVVKTDGDPSLSDEDALIVAARLEQSGIHRIVGEVRLAAPLEFDWQLTDDGTPLQKVLSGEARPAAWIALQQAGDMADVPLGIQFVPGDASPVATDAVSLPPRPLVEYRSPPLLALLKAIDDYSNNVLARFVSTIGGVATVESVARSVLPEEMASEITLGDAAGENPTNRMSPRAAVKLLRALEEQLAEYGDTLVDVLPVAGIDQGTLHDRLKSPQEIGRVVGKTGTYDSYGASALIGAFNTTDRGRIYFAILDHGIPHKKARPRQDRFVRTLLARLHSVPWHYRPDARPAFEQAEVVALPR